MAWINKVRNAPTRFVAFVFHLVKIVYTFSSEGSYVVHSVRESEFWAKAAVRH